MLCAVGNKLVSEQYRRETPFMNDFQSLGHSLLLHWPNACDILFRSTVTMSASPAQCCLCCVSHVGFSPIGSQDLLSTYEGQNSSDSDTPDSHLLGLALKSPSTATLVVRTWKALQVNHLESPPENCIYLFVLTTNLESFEYPGP